ncbi:MAG: ribosome silencing factor [Bacteroidales bacterium]
MKQSSKAEPNSDQLVNRIIEGIQEKKGHDIVSMDLRKLDHAVCDYFVICHGTSDTQVAAISESVKDYVREHEQLSPVHIEGADNAEWILIDYFDVVVHVFLERMRSFYQLEELWADATIKTYEDIY